MILKNLTKFRDLGLLLLRLGIGIVFIFHGYPKLFNPEMWPNLGRAMANLGITFGYSFWGFMAAFSEFGGAILLILGFFFRPACFLLFFTMFVAAIMHLSAGHGFSVASHAIELTIIFFSLIFIGPGKFSIDRE